jgi:hypothetical protein
VSATLHPPLHGVDPSGMPAGVRRATSIRALRLGGREEPLSDALAALGPDETQEATNRGYDIAARPRRRALAALTALPKATVLTTYSYRLEHSRQAPSCALSAGPRSRPAWRTARH